MCKCALDFVLKPCRASSTSSKELRIKDDVQLHIYTLIFCHSPLLNVIHSHIALTKVSEIIAR